MWCSQQTLQQGEDRLMGAVTPRSPPCQQNFVPLWRRARCALTKALSNIGSLAP